MRTILLLITILISGLAINAQSPLDALSSLEIDQAVTTVSARAGDTIKSLAERYGADPVEVAKYNGVLPNSVLGAGREIKLPHGGRGLKNAPVACSLKISDLPEIRGLKLGMPKSAMLALLKPEFRDHPWDLMGYSFLGDFEGIRSVNVEFWDEKLMKFGIRYEYDAGLGNDRELAHLIGERLHLPELAWRSVSPFEGTIMTCAEFKISVFMHEMVVDDLAAKKIIADFEKAKIERKKAAFRP